MRRSCCRLALPGCTCSPKILGGRGRCLYKGRRRTDTHALVAMATDVSAPAAAVKDATPVNAAPTLAAGAPGANGANSVASTANQILFKVRSTTYFVCCFAATFLCLQHTYLHPCRMPGDAFVRRIVDDRLTCLALYLAEHRVGTECMRMIGIAECWEQDVRMYGTIKHVVHISQH